MLTQTVIPQELGNDWEKLLADEFDKPYYRDLSAFLLEEYRNGVIYPAKADVFAALRLTSYAGTKVVILGQDPYHGPGQAHGLSFSVRPGAKIPPSLRNIFKELQQDLGCRMPNHGCLEHWARQGVLLLNTVLTVREGVPQSHRGKGWETFTDRVIQLLNKREMPAVFLLWGRPAQSKLSLIDTNRHGVFTAAHPSPLSARHFFGSRPFSQANAFLRESGQTEIDWQLPDVQTPGTYGGG